MKKQTNVETLDGVESKSKNERKRGSERRLAKQKVHVGKEVKCTFVKSKL
jgi:hypothetical protein